jgi:hypothetical protein
LEDKENNAEDLLLKRQYQVNKALVRISRLRKIQKQLYKKGIEILKKGLNDIEELEEEERKEAEEKSYREELERVQVQEAELIFQV